MSKKYMVESNDQRDGGSHLLILCMIDDATGAKSRMTIAKFEPSFKDAAQKYADYLNGVGSKEKS